MSDSRLPSHRLFCVAMDSDSMRQLRSVAVAVSVGSLLAAPSANATVKEMDQFRGATTTGQKLNVEVMKGGKRVVVEFFVKSESLTCTSPNGSQPVWQGLTGGQAALKRDGTFFGARPFTRTFYLDFPGGTQVDSNGNYVEVPAGKVVIKQTD